jgi:hypothetical protein
MTDQHSITPPPELVQQWASTHDYSIAPAWMLTDLATRAAQWGADQELEACAHRQALLYGNRAAKELRAARRPRPPSLKKQAIADFKWLIGRTVGNPEADTRSKRILQALESLSDD